MQEQGDEQTKSLSTLQVFERELETRNPRTQSNASTDRPDIRSSWSLLSIVSITKEKVNNPRAKPSLFSIRWHRWQHVHHWIKLHMIFFHIYSKHKILMR